MRKPVIPVTAIAPASALVWWVVGFLPWLVDGLGKDVPGVYIGSVASDGITVPLLLPNLALLVLGGLVGGACAGLLTTLSAGSPTAALAASFAGVACAVLLTGIQSSNAIGDGIGSGYGSDASVISGLLATTAGASLLGWLFGASGYFGRVPLGIALCGLAGAVPSWLSYLVFGIDPDIRSELLRTAITYAGAAVLVAGIVLIGVRPYVRLLAWPPAIVLAWVVAPALGATAYMGGTLRPPVTPSDALGPAWDIFVLAVQPANIPADWLISFVVAVGLALAISVRLEMRRGSSDDAPDEGHSPVEPSNNSRTTSM